MRKALSLDKDRKSVRENGKEVLVDTPSFWMNIYYGKQKPNCDLKVITHCFWMLWVYLIIDTSTVCLGLDNIQIKGIGFMFSWVRNPKTQCN
jgi:hypothetical protein